MQVVTVLRLWTPKHTNTLPPSLAAKVRSKRTVGSGRLWKVLEGCGSLGEDGPGLHGAFDEAGCTMHRDSSHFWFVSIREIGVSSLKSAFRSLPAPPPQPSNLP
jgi:hypothetical protein